MYDNGFPLKVESLEPRLKCSVIAPDWIWLGNGPEPTWGPKWTWFRNRLIRRRQLWRWWELARVHIFRRPPHWRIKMLGEYFAEPGL